MGVNNIAYVSILECERTRTRHSHCGQFMPSSEFQSSSASEPAPDSVEMQYRQMLLVSILECERTRTRRVNFGVALNDGLVSILECERTRTRLDLTQSLAA